MDEMGNVASVTKDKSGGIHQGRGVGRSQKPGGVGYGTFCHS